MAFRIYSIYVIVRFGAPSLLTLYWGVETCICLCMGVAVECSTPEGAEGLLPRVPLLSSASRMFGHDYVQNKL